MRRLPVALLGATGIVGQQYVLLLADHPWFEIAYLAASDRSIGATYQEAVAGRWIPSLPLPQKIAEMRLGSIDRVPLHCKIAFSAASGPNIPALEQALASRGVGVVSHASAHRHCTEIPVIIPEINPHHLAILPEEGGWIVAKPNCSIQSYLLPLAPLHDRFGIRKIHVTTLQALSGGGLDQLGMTGNVIPYIAGEEEKSEQEPLKIMGEVRDGQIVPTSAFAISAHCNRVPVLDGHLACVSVAFAHKPTREEILEIWRTFRGAPQELNLPTAPSQPIHYFDALDRPQPQNDCHLERGMAVSVGRLRHCPLLDFRFVALSHNAIRGAAGGALLTAELLLASRRDIR